MEQMLTETSAATATATANASSVASLAPAAARPSLVSPSAASNSCWQQLSCQMGCAGLGDTLLGSVYEVNKLTEKGL